jgi:CspA family cold shock protein
VSEAFRCAASTIRAQKPWFAKSRLSSLYRLLWFASQGLHVTRFARFGWIRPDRNLIDGPERTIQMATGTVSKFIDEKGFGFITPDAGGKDVFVHHSDIQMNGFKTLSPGQRVNYDLAQEAKGPKASNVTPA